jgi:flavin reductase (DIM6/NTAB) family NADH-FMN oxidoreductase RutF
MAAKEIPADAGVILPLIERGAFLTVQGSSDINTMTIGWGLMGTCWRKPVIMVAIRDSRFTYQLMEQTNNFTISMPAGNLRDEIFYCGTKSGQDVNKFEECGLKTAPGRVVASPIIDTAGTHLECQVIYKCPMDPGLLSEAQHSLYPQRDYHTLYFGEILACYELA